MDPSAKLSPEAARARLEQLAGLLRQAPHLEPEAQQHLAKLLEELASAIAKSPAPDEATKLAESAAHLAHAVHEQHQPSLAGAARHRLEESAARAEAKAPLATGIVRRLLAALADLGI
jgi:hypothetical protein